MLFLPAGRMASMWRQEISDPSIPVNGLECQADAELHAAGRHTAINLLERVNRVVLISVFTNLGHRIVIE